MNVYLYAHVNDETGLSGSYSFIVGNSDVFSGKGSDWTSVGAYLNGFKAASSYIIQHGLWKEIKYFSVCTPSSFISKIINDGLLVKYAENNWHDDHGVPLIHRVVLRELYYHYLFYFERDIGWYVMKEVTDMEFRQFERCRKYFEEE